MLTKSLSRFCLCFILVFSNSANADYRKSMDLSYKPTKPLQVFISITGFGKTRPWAETQCALYYKALANAGSVQVTCDWNQYSSFLNSNVTRAKDSGQFDFLVESLTDEQLQTHIRVVNWKKSKELDFFQLGWTLENSPNLNSNIAKLMRHVLQLKTNSEALRTVILANFAKDSHYIFYDEDEGQFKDQITHENIKLDDAEHIFMSESQKNKDYLTAAFEVASIMGVGLGFYYINVKSNQKDWDYPSITDAVKNLINGNKIKFDDNSFKSTNWPHTYAAVPEYLLCRANGFSNMESFLCSFTASLVWENIIEYREVFSINDQIATTMGGFVIGESLFQLSRLFNSKRGNSSMNRILASIFGSPDQFNRYVQRKVTKQSPLSIEPGSLEPSIWGQAEIYTKYNKVTKTNSNPAQELNSKAIWIGFESKTISIESWNEEGSSKGFQKTTAATELIFEGMQNSPQTGKDFYIFSKVAFAAWKQKSIQRDEVGNLNGYQFFIAPSSAIESRQSTDQNGQGDFFGVINVLGTTARLEMISGGSKIIAQLEFFGDFAMVRNLSIEAYMADNTSAGIASVIKDPKYYYAVGSTSRGQIIYERNNYSVGLEGVYHSWSSVNGAYRDQKVVTNDIKLADKEFELESFVKFKIAKDVQLKFFATILKRQSLIEGKYLRTSDEKRIGTKLSYLF